jgi:uncharacterized protein with von Willebrand factor type A (vWA) domain
MKKRWGLQALKGGSNMKTLDKVLKQIKDEIELEKHTVEYDNFDLRNFEQILDDTPKIRETYEEGIDSYPQFKELHQDVFDSLYKYAPEKVDEHSIDYEYLLNSKVMDAVMSSPKYKEMRLLTRLDIVSSTMGTQVIGDKVKELVNDLKDNFNEQLNKINEARGHLSEDGDSDSEASESDSALKLEEAKKLLEESFNNIDDLIKEKEEFRINSMLDIAYNQARETSDLIRNWGLEQDPTYIKSGYQEKIKLLDTIRNSTKLKELAELSGRYKHWAVKQQKSKTRYGVESLRGVTVGNDIGKLLPSELMKLKHPVLKKLFKKNLLEKSLFQYEYYPQTKESKGPIVCCIDSSGSMYGIKEIWAKAVALGLLEIARMQKRSFYAIHFSSSWRDSSLHTNDFGKRNPYSITNVIDLAEYFEGGGTMFEPPLNLARQKVTEASEYKKADIVFITDGESAVRDSWVSEFNQWKNSIGLKVYSVLIDSGYNFKSTLEEFSDEIHKISKFNEKTFDETASILFKAL